MFKMPVRTPRPMKRQGSSVYQLTLAVPRDVAEQARGLNLAIPIGDGTVTKTVSATAKVVEVRVSLQTRDPKEAKAREAAARTYLDRVWRSIREGRAEPTQAIPPKLESVSEEKIPTEQKLSRQGLLKILKMEESILKEVSLYRRSLIRTHLNRFGSGTRPRLHIEREPGQRVFRLSMRAAPEAKRVKLMDVFDAYVNEKRPARSTVDQWRKHVADFAEFLGHDDAGRVTKLDVVRWKDALVAANVAPKTINDSKLAALKAAFEWGVRNVRVKVNPAAGVSVQRRKRPTEKMLGFDDAEAAAILKASAKEKRASIRWLPLLCATSGARVGEMAQLRAEDVIMVGGIQGVRITAEAGSLKNESSERVVPLHAAVIDAGFLAFVEGRSGPLFFDPARRKPNAKRLPHKIVAKNVAAWVSDLGLDVGRAHRKDPSHAWRHRFRTLARTAGVADSVAEAIIGHEAGRGGVNYGEVTIETMKRAIDLIPVPSLAGEGEEDSQAARPTGPPPTSSEARPTVFLSKDASASG